MLMDSFVFPLLDFSDDDMVTLFEWAYKKNPQSDEMGAQAFMANVRTGSWKSAQQVCPFLPVDPEHALTRTS